MKIGYLILPWAHIIPLSLLRVSHSSLVALIYIFPPLWSLLQEKKKWLILLLFKKIEGFAFLSFPTTQNQCPI